MAEQYTISAEPRLYPEGEYKGKLRSVTFTAICPGSTRQWVANNRGHFELAFTRIMPEEAARAVVEALERGDTVDLPGSYHEHQFHQGFLFEWSPVYLVLPPIFFPRAV
jgi:hypothetical protein